MCNCDLKNGMIDDLFYLFWKTFEKISGIAVEIDDNVGSDNSVAITVLIERTYQPNKKKKRAS